MDWMDRIGKDLPKEEYIDALNVPDDEETKWKKTRLGKVTGSVLGKVVKKSGKDYKLSESKKAKDLLYKIAWERFLMTESVGMNRLSFDSAATNHGHDFEYQGMKAFTKETGLEVVPGGYVFYNKGDYFGGTPDGFVGEDALIEIKCPWNGGNHIKTLLTGEIYNDDHYYQIQGYLYLTDRKMCYYVTYDPDMPDGIELAIVEVERDEDVITAIERIVKECRNIILGMIEKCKEKQIK